MAATLILCERNGAFPGKVTENIKNIDWKAIDDTVTPYNNHNASIAVGTNSYTKYNFIKFAGQFSTIGNVKITHSLGSLNSTIKLVSSPTAILNTNKKVYDTPTRIKQQNITPNNISELGSVVNLMIGPATTVDGDPAYTDTKFRIADNTNGQLYSNYFITQLQTTPAVKTGDINTINLRITYDEA